jgi:hypothetical protein
MIIVFHALCAQVQPTSASVTVFISGPVSTAAAEVVNTFTYKTLN